MTKLFAVAAVFIVFITLGFASAEAQNALGGTRTLSRESTQANSGDGVPTIFDVRKSLPMEPTDPTYHDFYINQGSESGFKKGQYLPISRAIPIHDPVQNKQQAILTVPVGKVLVIHVEHGLTVARLVSELGDDERPTLEYEAIMIGDRVDVKGITTEAPKDAGKKRKKNATAAAAPAVVAEVQVERPEAPAAQAEAPTQAVAPVAAPKALDNSVKTDVPSQPSSPPRVTQPVPPPTA